MCYRFYNVRIKYAKLYLFSKDSCSLASKAALKSNYYKEKKKKKKEYKK